MLFFNLAISCLDNYMIYFSFFVRARTPLVVILSLVSWVCCANIALMRSWMLVAFLFLPRFRRPQAPGSRLLSLIQSLLFRYVAGSGFSDTARVYVLNTLYFTLTGRNFFHYFLFFLDV